MLVTSLFSGAAISDLGDIFSYARRFQQSSYIYYLAAQLVFADIVGLMTRIITNTGACNIVVITYDSVIFVHSNLARYYNSGLISNKNN